VVFITFNEAVAVRVSLGELLPLGHVTSALPLRFRRRVVPRVAYVCPSVCALIHLVRITCTLNYTTLIPLRQATIRLFQLFQNRHS
jgi:hypothetical protein